MLASELRLYRDALFVGFETGGATGDQAEAPGQYLNYRWHFVQQPTGDHTMNDFHFSPDYHVDEILFRHILGTVTNAVYIKPQAAYWFDLGRTRALGLNGSIIYSMAQVPVSTPGNDADDTASRWTSAPAIATPPRGSTPASPGACSGRWRALNRNTPL